MEEQIFTGFSQGMVVISKAGRDKGKPLMVIDTDGAAVYVADGKERPLERAKKKNPKHLMKTKMTISKEKMKKLTNRSLRRLLSEGFSGDPRKQECE